VATYETEEQQVEELKKWWNENGKSVVAGVMIGFALLAGWRWWQSYTEQQAQIASSFYEQVLSSIETEDLEKARGFAGKLLSDHGSSPYAILTALNLAQQDLKQGDIDAAHARLQWAIDQNSRLTELTHLARLRKARLFLSQNKLTEANALVKNVDIGQFQGAYAEIRGDIATAEGQLEIARTAYDEALASEQLATQHQEWVQIKRDDLGPKQEDRIEANWPLSDSGNPSTLQNDSLTISESESTIPSATSDEAVTNAESETLSTHDKQTEAKTPLSDSGNPNTTQTNALPVSKSEPENSNKIPSHFFDSLKISDFAPATTKNDDDHQIIESTGETPSTTQTNTLTITDKPVSQD